MGKVTTLLSLIWSFGFSQTGFHMGFRVMPLYTLSANQDDKELGNFTSRAPQIMGSGQIFFGHHFNEHYGLEGGFGFQRYAMRYTKDEKSTLTRLDYLTIPISFVGNSHSRRRVQLVYHIGLQMEVLQNAWWDYKTEEAPKTDIPPLTEMYNKVNYSGLLAIGVQLKLAWQVYFTAMARATYSFTDAENKSAQSLGKDFWETRLYDTPSRGAATHNGTIGLQLGLNMVISARNKHH